MSIYSSVISIDVYCGSCRRSPLLTLSMRARLLGSRLGLLSTWYINILLLSMLLTSFADGSQG